MMLLPALSVNAQAITINTYLETNPIDFNGRWDQNEWNNATTNSRTVYLPELGKNVTAYHRSLHNVTDTTISPVKKYFWRGIFVAPWITQDELGNRVNIAISRNKDNSSYPRADDWYIALARVYPNDHSTVLSNMTCIFKGGEAPASWIEAGCSTTNVVEKPFEVRWKWSLSKTPYSNNTAWIVEVLVDIAAFAIPVKTTTTMNCTQTAGNVTYNCTSTCTAEFKYIPDEASIHLWIGNWCKYNKIPVGVSITDSKGDIPSTYKLHKFHWKYLHMPEFSSAVLVMSVMIIIPLLILQRRRRRLT